MEHVGCLSRNTGPDEIEQRLNDKVTLNIDKMSMNYDNFRQQQEEDDEVKLFQELNELTLINGVWAFRGRLFIPKRMRKEMLVAHHYSPWGAHPRTSKLLRKLTQNYFWPEIRKDTRNISFPAVP